MNETTLQRRAELYSTGPGKPGVDRGAQFFVKSGSDPSPTAFLAIFANAKQKAVASFCGGCKRLNDATRAQMFITIASALTRADGSKFAGCVMSGGTEARPSELGPRTDAITQVPSYIAGLEGFDVVAVAHIPKTGVLSLAPQTGRVVLDNYWTGIDLGHHGVLLVQPDVNTGGGWDADVPEYRTWLTGLRDMAGFAVAQVAINGGDITRDEIYDGLLAGIPTIILKGSGREADAAVAAMERGDWSLTAAELRSKKGDTVADAAVEAAKAKLGNIDRSLIYICDLADVDALRAGFEKFGIL